VDAVSLCTPPGGHAGQVEELARAGVHILAEKPMATTLADCQRMIQAARGVGIRLMIGQKKRFYPLYAFLKEKFDGDFGQPRWVSVKYALGRVDKAWFWDEADGGGPIQENAIHQWDLLRFFLGEPERVHAEGGNLFRPDVAQIDTAVVTIRFRGGAVASVACGYGSEWGFADERVSFATPTAVCEVNGPFDRPNSLRYIRRHDPRNVQELHFEKMDGFREEIAEFVAAIEEGRDPLVTGEDAMKSIALALAVKRSIREGRSIEM
jgi:predicted dehydrogenase